jgi:hypothetical protein
VRVKSLLEPLLRISNAAFCVLLTAFAAVQYNDPDIYLWIPVYLLPAFLSGRLAYRPADPLTPLMHTFLVVGLGAGIAATVWTWPEVEGFWRREVWWESEPVRESMGLMIAVAALVVAAISASIHTRRRGAR